MTTSELLEAYAEGERDFRKANLSRANLSGADLSEANLSRANLSGAHLSRANLSRANLSGADLSEANLREANLSGADLSGANLSRANLSRANLSGANLSRADLSRANLAEANLSSVNAEGCSRIMTAQGGSGWQMVFVECGDHVKIHSGCRHFSSLEEARQHWHKNMDRPEGHITEVLETLDFLTNRAKQKGWPVK